MGQKEPLGRDLVCHTETLVVVHRSPFLDLFGTVRLLVNVGVHSWESPVIFRGELPGLHVEIGRSVDLWVDDRHRILSNARGLDFLVYDRYLRMFCHLVELPVVEAFGLRDGLVKSCEKVFLNSFDPRIYEYQYVGKDVDYQVAFDLYPEKLPGSRQLDQDAGEK